MFNDIGVGKQAGTESINENFYENVYTAWKYRNKYSRF